MYGSGNRRKNVSVSYSQKQLRLIVAFRELWGTYVFWLRSAAVSVAGDLPDLPAAITRLHRWPVAFGDVLRGFYSGARVDPVQELLQDHLLIAESLLNAEKAGDTAGAEAWKRKWRENAAALAAALEEINPFWRRAELELRLEKLLKLAETGIACRMSGDYEAEAAAWSELLGCAQETGEVMAEGISRQFQR